MSSQTPPDDWSVTERVDVLARVSLVPTDEGGREQPLLGTYSYRPNHNFFEPDNIVMCMGELQISPEEPRFPGEVFECLIRMILHPEIADSMAPGRKWRIQEGRKLVANAEVIELRARKPLRA